MFGYQLATMQIHRRSVVQRHGSLVYPIGATSVCQPGIYAAHLQAERTGRRQALQINRQPVYWLEKGRKLHIGILLAEPLYAGPHAPPNTMSLSYHRVVSSRESVPQPSRLKFVVTSSLLRSGLCARKHEGWEAYRLAGAEPGDETHDSCAHCVAGPRCQEFSL